MKWTKVYSYLLLTLFFGGAIVGMISTCKRDYKNTSLLDYNYIYIIGYYNGIEKKGKSHRFVYEYNGERYNDDVGAIKKQDFKKIYGILNETEKGTRFLTKVCLDKPKVAAILIDYPIPEDIADHPKDGWKEIPNWDEEREKGNVRETPYQTSEALVYTYPKNNNAIWFAIGLFILVAPLYFDKKNLDDLLSGKYYTGFLQIGDIIKKYRKEEKNKPDK